MNPNTPNSKSKMTRALSTALLFASLAMPTAFIAGQTHTSAQSASAPAEAGKLAPMIAYNKEIYEGIKGVLLRSAEKMPEENFNFKPTDAVRTYGQILGHIADSHYYLGSLILGEKHPGLQIEKTKTTKAEIIAALKEAFAYVDKVFSSIDDSNAVQTVKLFSGDTPKLGVLTVNSLHSIEHYGNLVTYMRIKNIVPPTSEQKAEPNTK